MLNIWRRAGNSHISNSMAIQHKLKYENFAKFCQTMPNYAQQGQTMPNYAKLCQNMPNYAKVCLLYGDLASLAILCHCVYLKLYDAAIRF